MPYIENPKTKGSGLIACIPQKGPCPNNCEDCFFQSGRSYLEPLEENTPNMPSDEQAEGMVVRVNDGNDSHNNVWTVVVDTMRYEMRFFNTCYLDNLDLYPAPVIVTVNPGSMTGRFFSKILSPQPNLMAVRVRVNTWNLGIVDRAVNFYSSSQIPIILTFMAYFDAPIPRTHKKYYINRKRTSNPYRAITTAAWEMVMSRYKYNKWVYSCGKIEGELGDSHCRFCGNCLREYFATMERMRNDHL